jgi:4-hydroxy-tetrahydrodipicolinate reductase
MSIKIAVNGASGRMGLALIQACAQHQQTQLQAAYVRAGSESVGRDAGEMAGIGVNAVAVSALPSSDHSAVSTDAMAWIDFSLPAGALDGLAYCLATNTPMIIGTTGFSTEQKQAIYAAGQTIPIVFAPNMSVGVNLCLNLLRTAASTLGHEYDIEVVEAHHRHKVDAPSGTALRMGEVIADALEIDLDSAAVYTREGDIGQREKGSIGFQTIRAGDIVGEHTVMFAGIGERVEIVHRASSRLTFANGAMRAAVWLQTQKPGVYDMQDVLALS